MLESKIGRSVASILVLAFLLSACAEPARQEAMVPGHIDPTSSSSTYRRTVSNVVAYGGEETNPLWTSEVSKDDFQQALEASIKQAGLYSEGGRYTLRADILTVEQPFAGLDLKVTMTVRYNLIDGNGRVRFDETISSIYVAKFSDSLIAVERLKLANEGAARENISKFLKRVGVSAQAAKIAVVS